MLSFEELRQRHKTFIYHAYTANNDGFSYHFSIDDYHFYPEWKFPEHYTMSIQDDEDRAFYEALVFNIGMSELVSYWKAACPPVVEVRCGELDNFAIAWWKKLYYNGLGEFFYKNNIKTDVDSFMTIKADAKVKTFVSKKSLDGCLIPVGGGKDSIVTLELLSDMVDRNACYMINPRGSMINSATQAGFKDTQIIGVTRTIDKTLLELNAKGYLNGHTPVSSVIAFSAFTFAWLLGKRYVVLSNESSANEGNVGDTEINHQYSKSTEFESDFRDYTARYFNNAPEYFSLLRPWSEWQIAKEFVKNPRYFSVFRSCNVGSKRDEWCANCAKCLYVYVMLSAFLQDEVLIEIFGRDMLDDENMRDLLNGLASPDYDKPFECVGTRDEVRLALKTAVELRKDKALPLLLKDKEILQFDVKEHDTFFDENNFVPDEYLPRLKRSN